MIPVFDTNIESGTIEINGKVIHSGRLENYNKNSIHNMCESENLSLPATEVRLDGFKSSSKYVLNQVMNEINALIDEEQGLC